MSVKDTAVSASARPLAAHSLMSLDVASALMSAMLSTRSLYKPFAALSMMIESGWSCENVDSRAI